MVVLCDNRLLGKWIGKQGNKETGRKQGRSSQTYLSHLVYLSTSDYTYRRGYKQTEPKGRVLSAGRQPVRLQLVVRSPQLAIQ